MFWDKFVAICTEKGKSPSAAIEEIGLTPAVGTQWSNGATPRKKLYIKLQNTFMLTPVNL